MSSIRDLIDNRWARIQRTTDPRVLADWRSGKARRLLHVAVAVANSVANAPTPKGALWRRAVLSKNRRIRRKGEKARRGWLLVWSAVAVASGMARTAAIMGEAPPREKQ